MLACFAFALRIDAARAQTAADLSAAVGNVCAVLAGQQKADARTLQYLLLMDEDLADANPVALGLYRGVVHRCPKAYVAYEQRKRTSNPFANSGLTTGASTPRSAPPQTYALVCRGRRAMASARGATLTIAFAGARRPAAAGLLPGQCSWSDRGVRPSEPARIVVPLGSAAEARNGVVQINAGGLWTFRVYAAGGILRATVVAKGATL